MKLGNITQIKEFLEIIPKCKGDVWVESIEGDKFNLKSQLSQYIAIGRMIESHGADLELFAPMREDEALFLEFFAKYPMTI